MSVTIRQVVDDALELVGEVTGSGTQQFGDDRMRSNAVRAFDMLFKKYPWHQFRKWWRLELDGTLGIVTTDVFGQVRDFEDFFKVVRDGETVDLPMWPRNGNPYGSGIVGGTQARYWTSLSTTDINYDKRKIQIYPVTSVGFINVGALEYPLPPPALTWNWQDKWFLDRALLVYATAFMTLVGDDLNANAANTVRGMMEAKFNDIKVALARIPKAVDPSSGTIPSTWREV